MTDAFSMVLPVDLTTPRAARDAVAERFGTEARCGDLVLCISEVVTNAVRHAGTVGRMTVSRDRHILTVEVADGSRDLPVRRPPSSIAASGRGLRILDQLALQWGTRRTSDGKIVWFEFDLTTSA
ncbi:MAG: ATP-binding protein [Acidimicrobiales bacterium]